MSKGKLAKFADMAANPLVIEQPFNTIKEETVFGLKGRWHEDFFHNQNPIVLELGCGRGEYTVGLARLYSDKRSATIGDACVEKRSKNFIGVDIKGARMWTGAQDALNSGMKNVAFLRTHIEFIDRFFAPNEVSEIWLTFSDPQMKKATKRLTSTYFLQRYRRFLTDNGLIHLKTDSNFLYTYTEEMLRVNDIEPEYSTRDLYGDPNSCSDNAKQAAKPVTSFFTPNSSFDLSIQTYYEQMWRDRGIPIKYLRFRLPQSGALIEPDVEIPLDEYRSYNRSKRSGNETGR